MDFLSRSTLVMAALYVSSFAGGFLLGLKFRGPQFEETASRPRDVTTGAPRFIQDAERVRLLTLSQKDQELIAMNAYALQNVALTTTDPRILLDIVKYNRNVTTAILTVVINRLLTIDAKSTVLIDAAISVYVRHERFIDKPLALLLLKAIQNETEYFPIKMRESLNYTVRRL